jgi:linearmycin/streptolysin S transport system ATP-binding protein
VTVEPRASAEADGAAVLAVRDAEKRFGEVEALRGVSVELRHGELLALLGPNGAGKTTLIRAIAGRVVLDRGTIELFGRPLAPRVPRQDLGVVPQEIALYPLLSCRENLEAFARLQGVPRARLAARVEWALQWTGLAERARQQVRHFSGGMRRRLNIACGVLHEPAVVLLDEPTVGVDPQSRERIYEMLDGLRAAGASLLLTTHQLDEAERRCDRIVILDHGRVVAAGSLAALIEATLGRERAVVVSVSPAGGEVPGMQSENGGRRLRAPLTDLGTELPALLQRVRGAGLTVEDVEIRRRGLHDVFLQLTGRELRE